MSDGVGAGWFADDKDGYERWWDGSAWTGHYRLSQQTQVELHHMASQSQPRPQRVASRPTRSASSSPRYSASPNAVASADTDQARDGWSTPEVMTIEADNIWRPELDLEGGRGTASGASRWFIWAGAGSLALLIVLLAGVLTSGAEPARDGFQDKTAVGDSLPDPVSRPANIGTADPVESPAVGPAGMASNVPVGATSGGSIIAEPGAAPTTSVPASTMPAPPTIATP